MTQVAVIHAAFEDIAKTVAFVEVGERTGDEALEYAYRSTNNVMGSWSIKEKILGDDVNSDYNEDVTVMAELPVHNGQEYGLRSTSMGDFILLGNKKYKVAMIGFEEVV